MSFVALAAADDETRFGAKIALLSAAVRAGLPVPAGYALAADALAALASSGAEPSLLLTAAELPDLPALGPVAVRASSLGSAAHGGGSLSLLRVSGAPALLGALRAVHASRAHDAPAAALVQRMIEPRCAGVLWTRDPVSGAEEYVVEASWDAAESADGMVAPDRYRLAYSGKLLETLLGERPAAALAAATGGARPRARSLIQADAPCLERAQLSALAELARGCQALFGRHLDLDWAFAADGLHLLGARPISTLTTA
jgi:pyruvate,water dikinase